VSLLASPQCDPCLEPLPEGRCRSTSASHLNVSPTIYRHLYPVKPFRLVFPFSLRHPRPKHLLTPHKPPVEDGKMLSTSWLCLPHCHESLFLERAGRPFRASCYDLPDVALTMNVVIYSEIHWTATFSQHFSHKRATAHFTKSTTYNHSLPTPSYSCKWHETHATARHLTLRLEVCWQDDIDTRSEPWNRVFVTIGVV
jgi:hypothetical protein